MQTVCFQMFFLVGTSITGFSWHGAEEPVWAAHPLVCPIIWVCLQVKRSHCSWNRWAAALKQVFDNRFLSLVTVSKGWPYPPTQEIQTTKLQNTGSAIKILILIVKCLHNVTFLVTGLIQAYLSFGIFGVSRIQKDSSIHQCAMHVCHHRSYVPPTIRWTAILWKNISIKVTLEHIRLTSPTCPFSSPNIFHLHIMLHWQYSK